MKSCDATRSRSENFGEERSRSFSGGSAFRQRSGVTVRETKNDPKRATVIVSVSGMKRSFGSPARKTIGRKTMTVVSVETKIGDATSLAASRVAAIFDCPSFRWL